LEPSGPHCAAAGGADRRLARASTSTSLSITTQRSAMGTTARYRVLHLLLFVPEHLLFLKKREKKKNGVTSPAVRGAGWG
jgi:hypothetical protein